MSQLFIIAFRSLLQHRRRTFVLGGAIALVTALLLTLAGLYNGMRATLLNAATTLMSGHVNVSGFYKVTASQSAPLITDYKKLRGIVEREVPDIDYTVVRGRGWAKLVSDTASIQCGIGGLDIDQEKGFKKVLQIVSGNVEDLSKPNGILLFEKQAKRLGVKVGDPLTLSAPTFRGENNTLDVVVVAIAADLGMLSGWNTYMNDQGLRRLYAMNDNTSGAIQIYLKDITKVHEVEGHLRKVLADDGYVMMDENPLPFFMKFDSVNRESWSGQRLDITNWEDETAFVKWTMLLIAFLSSVLMGILLVIIALGVWLVMWISIRERTREIGTLRAIGMQRGRVRSMFLVEGFLLGGGSTVVGVAAGLLFALVVNALNISMPDMLQFLLLSDRLYLLPTAGWSVFAVIFITAAITLISIVPSHLASRLKPVTAMSHIG